MVLSRQRALRPELWTVVGRPHLFRDLPSYSRFYTGIELHCLVTEAQGCTQHARGCHVVASRPRVEPATSPSRVWRPSVAPGRRPLRDAIRQCHRVNDADWCARRRIVLQAGEMHWTESGAPVHHVADHTSATRHLTWLQLTLIQSVPRSVWYIQGWI